MLEKCLPSRRVHDRFDQTVPAVSEICRIASVMNNFGNPILHVVQIRRIPPLAIRADKQQPLPIKNIPRPVLHLPHKPVQRSGNECQGGIVSLRGCVTAVTVAGEYDSVESSVHQHDFFIRSIRSAPVTVETVNFVETPAPSELRVGGDHLQRKSRPLADTGRTGGSPGPRNQRRRLNARRTDSDRLRFVKTRRQSAQIDTFTQGEVTKIPPFLRLEQDVVRGEPCGIRLTPVVGERQSYCRGRQNNIAGAGALAEAL